MADSGSVFNVQHISGRGKNKDYLRVKSKNIYGTDTNNNTIAIYKLERY